MRKKRFVAELRKGYCGCSRGFTLIEVLLAIAILGIISITVLGGLSTAFSVMMVGDERTTAESLARRQIEYVKGQIYQPGSELNNNNPTYQKIDAVPENYSLWSLNSTGDLVPDIVGIPWDSENKRPADKDLGLQKIALVVKHIDKYGQEKVVRTFVNDNPYWAYGQEITLEGYKVNR